MTALWLQDRDGASTPWSSSTTNVIVNKVLYRRAKVGDLRSAVAVQETVMLAVEHLFARPGVTLDSSAVVFDAYGTLFDVASIAQACAELTAEPDALATVWRAKQLEYSWVRADGTRANGQPAFGYHVRSQPRGLMVLTLSSSKVDEITFVADPALPAPGRFGLPEHIWRGDRPSQVARHR